MQLGGSDFLAKPFGADELRAQGARAASRSHATRRKDEVETPHRRGSDWSDALPFAAGRTSTVAEALEGCGTTGIVYDGVTGLPLHPFEDPNAHDERIEHLGVIYLQIGKFFGFEELFGWEHYDRVLRPRSRRSCRTTSSASRLAPYLHSIRFSGADGFFILYDLPPPVRGRAPDPPGGGGARACARASCGGCARRSRGRPRTS